jgi:RNA polymerase primary sigma factor
MIGINTDTYDEEDDDDFSAEQDEEESFIHSSQSHESNHFTAYLRQIASYPLLTVSEEQELGKKSISGDMRARDRIVTSNLKLVVHIARDYYSNGLSMMDLIAEGNIGLVTAAERFDPEKSGAGKFSTYAAWWIKQKIKRACTNMGKEVRLPVHVYDKIGLYNRIKNRLAAELKREVTPEDIAEETGIRLNKVQKLEDLSRRITFSLDSLRHNNDGPGDDDFHGAIADENAVEAGEELEHSDLLDRIRETMTIGILTPREQKIIQLRFYDNKTLEEVGRIYEVTRERIRQLQNAALEKIKKYIRRQESLARVQGAFAAESRNGHKNGKSTPQTSRGAGKLIILPEKTNRRQPMAGNRNFQERAGLTDEEMAQVPQIISQLPEKKQKIYRGFYEEGKTAQELADSCGLTAGSVSVYVGQLVGEVKQRLKPNPSGSAAPIPQGGDKKQELPENSGEEKPLEEHAVSSQDIPRSEAALSALFKGMSENDQAVLASLYGEGQGEVAACQQHGIEFSDLRRIQREGLALVFANAGNIMPPERTLKAAAVAERFAKEMRDLDCA